MQLAGKAATRVLRPAQRDRSDHHADQARQGSRRIARSPTASSARSRPSPAISARSCSRRSTTRRAGRRCCASTPYADLDALAQLAGTGARCSRRAKISSRAFEAQRVDTSFPGWVPADPATGQPPNMWKTAALVLLDALPGRHARTALSQSRASRGGLSAGAGHVHRQRDQRGAHDVAAHAARDPRLSSLALSRRPARSGSSR